jgi:hypothetical protein
VPAGRHAGTHAGPPPGPSEEAHSERRHRSSSRKDCKCGGLPRSLCVPYTYKATHHWELKRNLSSSSSPSPPLITLCGYKTHHHPQLQQSPKQNPCKDNHTTPLHLGVHSSHLISYLISFYLVPLAPVGATVSSLVVR